MISESYTTRLLFGRFLYQATVKLSYDATSSSDHNRDALALKPLKDWLSDNCNGSHKTNASWAVYLDLEVEPAVTFRVCTMRVYLDNLDDYERFVEHHKNDMVSTKRPANDIHVDMIKSGMNIEIRSHIYYNRYRYKLHFKGWWDSRVRKQTSALIRDRLHDRSRKHQNYLISKYGASLYLANEEDLAIIKMSVPELLSRITFAATESDLAS